MYRLHMNPYSFYARRVIALLAQCDLPYELREVNMAAGEHRSDAFLALNPNGQVPVLVDGDLTLAESNAILRYLCNKHALDDWYPGNTQARAEVDRWLDWTQCRLAPATRDIVFNTVFLGERGNKAEIAKGHEMLASLIPILEDRLSRSDHVAGPKPTIADLAVFSCLSQLGLAQTRPATSSISAWYHGMATLKGVAVTEELMARAMAA